MPEQAINKAPPIEIPKDPKKKALLMELARRVMCKRDLEFFTFYMNPGYQKNWHITQLAKKLQDVESGKIKRLMVFMPPRHMKSELSSIHFPAWILGRNPKSDIIAASYAAELSVEFGRKTRNIVADQRYQNIFGAQTKLSDDSASAQRWNTNNGGGYYAVGVGGSLTGRGAKYLLIDDPHKNREEAESKLERDRVWSWYLSTAYTRLTPDGAIVIVMTRWHEDDLAGRLLKEEANGGDKWEILSLPAIAEEDEEKRKIGEALWPERFPLTRLHEIKKTLGTYEWSALYQQNPLSEDSQEFKRSFFKTKDVSEIPKQNLKIYLTIDPAVSKKDSADYTGFCINFVDRENNWYLKAWHERLSPGDLINKLFSLNDKYNFNAIGVEHGMYSLVVKPFLDTEMRKRNKFLRMKELSHGGRNKEVRIRGLLPRYESGSIFHVSGSCIDLEDELLKFPKGKHDDVADAVGYQVDLVEPNGSVEFAGLTSLKSTPTPFVDRGMIKVEAHQFVLPDNSFDW